MVDVSDRAAVARVTAKAAAQLGPPDRVVTAAAIARVGSLLEQDTNEIDRLMAVNYGGTVNVCRATLPTMLDRGHGELVIFTSLGGWIPQAKMGTVFREQVGRRFCRDAMDGEPEPGSEAGSASVLHGPDGDALGLFRHAGEKRSMAISPGTVVDGIERCLAKGRFWVLPHPSGKVLWRLRRHAPNLLRRVVSTRRFEINSAA